MTPSGSVPSPTAQTFRAPTRTVAGGSGRYGSSPLPPPPPPPPRPFSFPDDAAAASPFTTAPLGDEDERGCCTLAAAAFDGTGDGAVRGRFAAEEEKEEDEEEKEAAGRGPHFAS